jgi:hypothetical protein
MYFFFFLISKFTNTKCLHIPTYVIYVDRLIKYPRTKLRDVVWDDTISIIVSLPFNLIEVNQIDFFYSAEAVLKSVKNLTRIRKSLTIHFWIIGFGNQTKARALRSEYFARNSAYVYWEKHSFGHTPIIAGTLNCLSPLEIWNRSLHHFFQVPPVVVLTQTISGLSLQILTISKTGLMDFLPWIHLSQIVSFNCKARPCLIILILSQI